MIARLERRPLIILDDWEGAIRLYPEVRRRI